MRTPDELRHVLGLVHAQIAAADSKATALLTVAGVLIAFPAPSILVRQPVEGIPPGAAIFATAAAIAFIVSIVSALYVLFSRVTNDSETHSLIFFGDIAGLNQRAYADVLHSADDARILDDLTSQIHICARIAAKKHGNFKLATRSLVVGIACISIAYMVLGFSRPRAESQIPPAVNAQHPR